MITRRHSALPRTLTRAAARAGGSRSPLGTRARVVWFSLLASMTLVGGLLLALDPRPVPRLDGLSMAPLVAAGAPASVDAVLHTRTPLDRTRWKSIVIHHTASPVGTPASITAENEARNIRGLGHHFLIGNGSGMADGELHVGYRWLDQLPGAHAAGPKGEWHNLHSISICLVGDGNRRPFTEAQTRRLIQLVSTLARELNIPPGHILLHSDVAATTDPGRLFPEADFRRQLSALR